MNAVRVSSWLALGMVLALLVYLWVARPVDLDRLWTTLQGLPWTLWPTLVALTAAHYACRFLRWHGYTKALGARIPVARNLVVYMAGFVPGFAVGKAGELVRGVYLRPYGLPYTATAAAVLTDRLLDVVSVGVLATLVLGLLSTHEAWPWSAIAFCVCVVLVLRSDWLVLGLGRFKKYRWLMHAQHGLSSLQLLLHGGPLLRGLGWSLLAWCFQGLCLWAALRAVDVAMSAHHAVGVYSVGILAGAASFIPGGFGASEAAMVWLLGGQGVNVSVALAAALVARGVPQWLGLAVAALALARLGAKPVLPVEPLDEMAADVQGRAAPEGVASAPQDTR